MAKAALLTDPGFVLKVEAYRFGRMTLAGRLERV
jgi:hypothetical protein